jgi:hypothetical protein
MSFTSVITNGRENICLSRPPAVGMQHFRCLTKTTRSTRVNQGHLIFLQGRLWYHAFNMTHQKFWTLLLGCRKLFHAKNNTCDKIVGFQCVLITSLKTYRVIQEEWSVFWEVILRVVVRKSSHLHVCNSEWLPKKSCSNLQIQKHCEW